MTTEPSAWILVIGDRDSLAWVLAEGRTAFPATRARAVQRLKAGDKLFIYTTRGCFHSPTRHRGRVIGEATVLGPVLPLGQPVSFVDRIFPLGCDLRIDSLAPLGLDSTWRPWFHRWRSSPSRRAGRSTCAAPRCRWATTMPSCFGASSTRLRRNLQNGSMPTSVWPAWDSSRPTDKASLWSWLASCSSPRRCTTAGLGTRR